MVTHLQIWRALDALAARQGLSPSGLAKLAGLDPTTFNKSKRGTAIGKLRWPSTESLAKVLSATGASLEDFVALASGDGAGRRGRIRPVPLIGLAQAGQAGYFDDAGFPRRQRLGRNRLSRFLRRTCLCVGDRGRFHVAVYRDGDRILVSPSGNLRRGDRVAVKTHAGEVMAKQLGRLTAQLIELKSFNPAYKDRSFPLTEIAFVHRIVWVSQ